MNDLKAAVRSYFKELKPLIIKLIVKPDEFFRTMPKAGGFRDPMIFVALSALLGVVLNAIIMFASGRGGFHELGMMAIWMVTLPLISLIVSFFFSGVCYSAWAFMGSRENFETGYRCVAYTQILFPVTILLSVVPYLGLLGIAWWLYLMVTATREVHKVPIMPAAVVFGIIAVLTALIYFSTVSASMKAKDRLEEYTRELQKMPGSGGTGNPGNR